LRRSWSRGSLGTRGGTFGLKEFGSTEFERGTGEKEDESFVDGVEELSGR